MTEWHNHIQPRLMQKKEAGAGVVSGRQRHENRVSRRYPELQENMISPSNNFQKYASNLYFIKQPKGWLGYDQKVQPVTTVSCEKRSFPKLQEAAFHPCCSGTESSTETLCCRLMSSRCITNMAEVHYWCPGWGAGFMTALGNDQENGPELRQHGHEARWQCALGESSWLSFQHAYSTHRLQGTLPDMAPQHSPKVQLYYGERENSILVHFLFTFKILFTAQITFSDLTHCSAAFMHILHGLHMF